VLPATRQRWLSRLYPSRLYFSIAHCTDLEDLPYDYNVVPKLIYNINKVTRWNDFRLSKIEKFSFCNRIVDIWNSLPNAVVDVDSVDLFKYGLDNYWMLQDVKYDYTFDLTGTGDWSEYESDSYWKVVVAFQERYEHRDSSKPVFVNIIDLTWLFHSPAKDLRYAAANDINRHRSTLSTLQISASSNANPIYLSWRKWYMNNRLEIYLGL